MAGQKPQATTQGASPSRQAEPAAPVPEPLSPQFRPIHSTTPIPPPTIPTFHRQTFTHKQHPPQVESIPQPPPPPPQPVDFSENVDVIALESAILLLQRQKQQAEDDIRQLQRIKNEAVRKPAEFVHDLASGKVGQGPQAVPPASGGGAGHDGDNDDESSSSDEGDDQDESDAEMEDQEGGGEASSSGLKPSPMKAPGKGKAAATAPQPQPQPQRQEPPPWTNLPTPQDVVRMPAINWSKYAVVGESLDKLHREQLAKPTLGTPAALAADGKAYEFKGGPNPDDGKKSVGIAAPYDPLHDKIKKPRK